MFGFIKNMCIWLFSACKTESFGGSLVSNSKGQIKCISLNNRPCQARLLVNIHSNKSLYYPVTVSVNLVEVVILLIIHMLEYVFQIKYKISM